MLLVNRLASRRARAVRALPARAPFSSRGRWSSSTAWTCGAVYTGTSLAVSAYWLVGRDHATPIRRCETGAVSGAIRA